MLLCKVLYFRVVCCTNMALFQECYYDNLVLRIYVMSRTSTLSRFFSVCLIRGDRFKYYFVSSPLYASKFSDIHLITGYLYPITYNKLYIRNRNGHLVVNKYSFQTGYHYQLRLSIGL